MPLPDDKALDQAAQQMSKLFQLERPRKNREEVRTLVGTLRKQSEDPKEGSAARFVFLREAAFQEALVGDLEQAYEIIDQLTRIFAVEAFPLRKQAVEKAAATGIPLPIRQATDAAPELVDQALAAERFEEALHLNDLVENGGTLLRHPPLSTYARKRAEEIDEIQKEFDHAKPALAILEKKPDDPEACLVVGRYRCLLQGDWSKGLPLLAKGSDPILKDLAARDLSQPAAPEAQEALADGWANTVDREKSVAQMQAARRAYHWYLQVVPQRPGPQRLTLGKKIPRLMKVIPVVPSLLIARWTFDVDGRDCITGIRGMLNELASVARGKLYFLPQGRLITGKLPFDLKEKTLEAWLS